MNNIPAKKPRRKAYTYLYVCLYVLALYIPQMSYSQDLEAVNRSFTLEQCIEYGLGHAPSIESAQESMLAQRATIQAAKASLWLPAISLNANGSYRWQDMNYAFPDVDMGTPSLTYLPWLSTTDYLTQDDLASFIGMNPGLFSSGSSMGSSGLGTSSYPFSGSVGLQISKPIFAGFALKKSVALEQIQYSITQLSLTETKRNLTKQIMMAFYNALWLQEMIALNQSNLDMAKESLESVAYTYEAGLVDELTYLQSELNYKQAIPQLRSTQNQYIKAKRQLLTLIGFSEPAQRNEAYSTLSLVGSFIDISDTLSNSTLSAPGDDNDDTNDAEEDIDVYQRPDMQKMNLEIDKMQLNLDISRSQFYPTISLFSDLSFTTSNDFTEETHMYGWSISGGIQIAFSLSDLVFPKSKTRSSLLALNHTLLSMKATQRNMAASMYMEIDAYQQDLEEAKENLILQQEIESLSKRNFEIAKEKWQRGMITFIEYRQVEIQYLQARIAIIQEQYNYTMALLNYRYATGQSLY